MNLIEDNITKSVLFRRFLLFICSVNFTNVLRAAAFMLVDPENVKKIDNLTVFFTLLGSSSVKAVRRMLMKLSHSLHKSSCVRACFDARSI